MALHELLEIVQVVVRIKFLSGRYIVSPAVTAKEFCEDAGYVFLAACPIRPSTTSIVWLR